MLNVPKINVPNYRHCSTALAPGYNDVCIRSRKHFWNIQHCLFVKLRQYPTKYRINISFDTSDEKAIVLLPFSLK